MFRGCSKLSGEDRKKSIIEAARRVFAEKGFDGTTTRALAQAAGVSEALLFKHFPNKDALYLAMQQSCTLLVSSERMERIKELESSTLTLVTIVHRMVADCLGQCLNKDGDAVIHHRLMMRSLMEDGEFARIFLQNSFALWTTKVGECLRAAVAAGDATAEPVIPETGAIFTRSLARIIMLAMMPTTAVIDFGMPTDCLVEQVVWFALRGMGVHDEAIRRCYRSEPVAVVSS